MTHEQQPLVLFLTGVVVSAFLVCLQCGLSASGPAFLALLFILYLGGKVLS